MFKRVFCLCLSLVFMASCGEKASDDGKKPIIVITSPDSPPFEFKDTARGDEVIGFDMDVVHKVGEQLGRPIKVIEADFSTLIPSLQSGRADMAIAYISPTEERSKSVDFSKPYYVTNVSLLVSENSNITSERDLQNVKLGVQLGTANENIAKNWEKDTPDLTLVSLNKIGELVQELKNGRIQAILLEEIVGRKIAKANPGLKVVVLPSLGTPLSIAFPKGSPLVAPTNEALDKMKDEIHQIELKWINE